MAPLDLVARRQQRSSVNRPNFLEPTQITSRVRSVSRQNSTSCLQKGSPQQKARSAVTVYSSCTSQDGSEPTASRPDLLHQSTLESHWSTTESHWMEASSVNHSQGWSTAQLPTQSYASTESTDGSWEFTGDNSYVPSPSNLPTGDGYLYLPQSALQRRDLWTFTDQPGIDMFLAGPLAWEGLSHVFVILFGVGERDTEGIYSLRAFGEEGVPVETIIAFEAEEDAQRYAALLEASMEHVPNVCSIPPRELLNFCMDQGYSCRLETDGTLLVPPDYNVGVTDWERSLRLREGQFTVLDEEPFTGVPSVAGQKQATAQLAKSQTTPTAASPALSRYTGFSDMELQSIKARLETLLPKD